jgi:hypothetical protein
LSIYIMCFKHKRVVNISLLPGFRYLKISSIS